MPGVRSVGRKEVPENLLNQALRSGGLGPLRGRAASCTPRAVYRESPHADPIWVASPENLSV